MHTTDSVERRAATTSGEAARSARRRFGWLAAGTALYTYALIVFGGLVRITGSGMGCGESWPRCNGEWIPAFDVPTLIEYGHRLLAAGLILPIAAVLFVAWRNRRDPGFAGPGGLVRPAGLVVGLLAVQVALGAITVKLALPASVTVLHFGTAALILATLVVAAVRAFSGGAFGRPTSGHGAGAAVAAAVLGFAVVVFGALTANTGAAPLCRGFPLCSGELLPDGNVYTYIHWTHRLLAFLLFFHVVGATVAAWRRGGAPAVRRAATTALALVLAQVGVAAALVLAGLPQSLQALHLAVGVALWGALVAWAVLARRAARPRTTAGALDPAGPV